MAEGSQYSLDFLYNGQGMEKHVSRLGGVTARATEKLKEMVNQKGYLFYSMKRIVSYTAIFSFFAAVGKAVSNVIELELRLAEVNTLIDKTNQEAVASYNQVTQALLRLDPHLGNAIELTKGLYEIISAGVTDPTKAFNLLVTSSKYAKVGLTDLATASSSLTGVMKAYGFTADAMRGKSDILFASVREGKFHTDELNAAIGKILPTAASMNVSIEEIVSALAVMTQRGLDVNEAATSLNRMLLSFLRPIDKAKARFEALGWEYGRNAFQSVTLTGALGRLEEASARYGDLLPVIFRRQRALRGAFILQGDGLRALESMYGRVTGATAGAGIVSKEYEKITGTVSMELKALQSNLLQGLSGMLQYKGAVAGVVRELSTFLRGIVENLPTVLGFGTAILIVKKAMRIMSSEFIFATIGQLAYNKAVRSGVSAKLAATAATKAATKATKASKYALGAVNVILLAALAAYSAITYFINKKREADKKAIEVANRNLKIHKTLNVELALMAEAWEVATGEVRDFGKELEQSLLTTGWDKILKKFGETTGEIGKSYKGTMEFLKKETATLGPHWKAQWQIILAAFTSGRKITQKEILSTLPLLKQLSFHWDITVDAQAKLAKNLKESSPEYLKVLMEMSQQTLKLARDLKMAGVELKTLPGDLALRYSKEELEGMAEALTRMKEGLTALEIDQMEMFDIDPKKMLEDLKAIELGIYNYGKAAEEAVGAQAAARIDDYTRTAVASWDTIKYSQKEALERAKALFDGFYEMRTDDKKDHLAWADKHKEEIEKIMRYSGKLEVDWKDHFDYLEALRKADKKGNKDWAEAYKNARNMVMDDTEKIESKMNVLRNMYREQEHENIMESFEREKISYLNHAYELMDIAIQSGENQAEALQLLQERLLLVAEWGREARRASQYKELQDFMNSQKETLNAMKQSVPERIATIEKMRQAALEFLDTTEFIDKAFKELLKGTIKDYFDELLKNTELGVNKLKEYEQFFRALGTTITSVAADLRDFFDTIGLGTSILGRLAQALSAVGAGASKFAQHLKTITESKDLAGTGGLDGILGTIGKMGGQIGAVVSIAQTASGVFKALFGGKTAEQKAEEAAARQKQQLDTMVSQMQAAYAHLGDLSDSMAKKMAEMRQAGMAGWLVEAKLLNEIMSDIGVTTENFNAFAGKTVDVMKMMKDGFIGMEEGADIVGGAFEQLIAHAVKFGTEGSRAILEMIWAARDMGLTVPAIAEYVGKKLAFAAAGLALAITWVAKDAVEAYDTIKELTKEKRKLLREVERIKEQMKGYEVGSEKYQEATDRLKELGVELDKFNRQINKNQELIDAHGKETKSHIKNLSIITEATFNAMLASGQPLLEVMYEMKDSVFALMERYKALGLEVPAYLKPIFRVFREFKKNPEFFEGLQGLQDAMKGLGDSGYMTVGAFRALNREAKNYYQQMTQTKDEGGFGFTDQQAIRMMYPMLQQMWWYAEQYGMKLPKWAKEAMQEAEKLGLKFEKPAVEQQIDIMTNMFTLQKKRLGRTVELLADIKRALKGTDSFQLGTPHTRGGFAHLHPGESVLPENVTSALKQFFMGKAGAPSGGEGGATEVNVYMDGQIIYKKMVPYIRKGAVYSDFEPSGDGVF